MKIPFNQLGWGGRLLLFSRKLLFGLFILYLLISSILLAIEHKDIKIVVLELGDQFFSPLQSAVEHIELIKASPGFWNYFGLYFQLFKLFLIVWVLMIPINFLLKDANALVIRLPFALAFFYIILVLYHVIALKQSPNAPFKLTFELLVGLKDLIINPQFRLGIGDLFQSNNTCVGDLCEF